MSNNKGSICPITQQGDGVKDTSLKTCQWRSKYKAYRAQKMMYNTNTRVRLASKCKRKTSSFQQQEIGCNNQHKPCVVQRWHAKLLKRLLKQNPSHDHEHLWRRMIHGEQRVVRPLLLFDDRGNGSDRLWGLRAHPPYAGGWKALFLLQVQGQRG
jgi:hypothetical protein